MSSASLTPPWQLRARFAQRLAGLYGREVPAYNTLVEVCAEVNQRVMKQRPAEAERLGSLSRVTAERHGAIRVGTPTELAQVARIFGALGMYPTGFYDLRDAEPQPIPVVSTAFRPHDPEELARNPFRVFTSMLVPQDRRFFDARVQHRLEEFLASRTLFDEELLNLADRAEADGGLAETDAERFEELAAATFALSSEPVDRAWYAELAEISGVAADIGGVTSTHLNHLTPRVLDIEDLYASMQDRGIEMIAEIQGPPGWEGPDLLLRQTSFRALAERRRFLEADGSIGSGELRVRFGEVEQRGIALTPAGRELFDACVVEADRRLAEQPGRTRVEVAREVWQQRMPRTEADLERRGLGYFRYRPADPQPPGAPPAELGAALAGGWLVAEPIVYEDFLPRSAAGIFNSNLNDQGSRDASQQAVERDQEWLAEMVGRPIADPFDLYAAERADSLRSAATALGAPPEQWQTDLGPANGSEGTG